MKIYKCESPRGANSAAFYLKPISWHRNHSPQWFAVKEGSDMVKNHMTTLGDQ